MALPVSETGKQGAHNGRLFGPITWRGGWRRYLAI